MDDILLLEDGTALAGSLFGAPRDVIVGEVVFNTSITGYQEILTDPSYRGQIVVLTASQIGNTGVNGRDMESDRVQAAGLIIRELSPRVSSWRAEGDLAGFMAEHGVCGMTGADTRALTRHIRSKGAMKGAIAPAGTAMEEVKRRLDDEPSMQGLDLASAVTCAMPYEWTEGSATEFGKRGRTPPEARHTDQPSRHVVALDFGIKRSILRHLVDAGFDRVTVVPADTSAADILALDPDGIFLSNGPGDPAAVTYAIQTVRQLLGAKPIFGICLGHQILALALGGKTFKLKFGHRGANHPVRHPEGGRVCITAQNHGFAVEPDLPASVIAMEINLNDGTVEAIAHPESQAMGVQYHPEAGPGPHEAAHHFRAFREMCDRALQGRSDFLVEVVTRRVDLADPPRTEARAER